jgi:tetratricopeptide (TPR) repeat protein
MTDEDPIALLRAGAAAAARDERTTAERAYHAAAAGHPEHAANAWFNLGTLYQRHGDVPAAVAAYRYTMTLGHPQFAPKAAVNLGFVLFTELGDLPGARAAFAAAIASGHPVQAPLAASNLAAMDQVAADDRLTPTDDDVKRRRRPRLRRLQISHLAPGRGLNACG